MTTLSTEAKIVFPAPMAIWATKPKFKHTPLGNAERLVHLYGHQIRYCPQWKTWLLWDQTRWVQDQCSEVNRMAMLTVRSIEKELEKEEDDELRSKKQSFARRSETHNNLESMIKLAATLSGMPVQPCQLDLDPYLFNCANGTLNLKTGVLQRHSREDYLTKLVPLNYEENAQCPIWLAFLRRIFSDDQSLLDFLQKAVGYSLTGCVHEKALFFLHGSGDNGKTTLLEAVRNIMGGYAGLMDIEALMKKAQVGEKERAFADLMGKRFVTSSEAAEGEPLHEARVKHMTGMGRLSARRIYGSPFEFDPQFKLFIDANHKPRISGAEEAIWNRFRLIPFNVSIPKEQQDRELGAKLAAEAPGILAWAVHGCLKWQKEGLGMPTAVASATESYRNEMDPITDFLSDCCDEIEGAITASGDLYQSYARWCDLYRHKPVSDKAFAMSLEKHGFRSVRTATARGRAGLALRQPAETAYRA